jgi:hypothetical protein
MVVPILWLTPSPIIVIFHVLRKSNSSDKVVIDGVVAPHTRQGKSGQWYGAKCRDRGVLSFVTAQAAGVSKLMDGSAGNRVVEFGWSCNTFDDASMWVQCPRPEVGEVFVDAFEARLRKAMGPRGKNVHLPVLNFCESIYALTAAEVGQERGQTHGTELHTPAQPLPRGNTGTIDQRWTQWSIATVGGVGSKAAGDCQAVGAVILDVPWRLVVCTRDNLIVNDCVICLQEEIISRFQRFGGYGPTADITILSICCVGHSAVLAMKPMMARVGGNYPSMLGLHFLLSPEGTYLLKYSKSGYL